MLCYKHLTIHNPMMGGAVSLKIDIHDFQLDLHQTTEERMAETAPLHFPLSERVPKAEGEAFDLKSWYRTWREGVLQNGGSAAEQLRDPSHLKVEAADEFQAVIPWADLDRAALLYRLNGEPIRKGYPLRLFVPDGRSKCLNVKGVVRFYFVSDRDGSLGKEAVFGFRNKLSAEDLKKRV